MKEAIVKINKTENWLLEKINKIDNHLPRLTKKKKTNKKQKYQINKIRNEKGKVTTNNAEIQRNMRLLRTTIWQ